MAVVFTENRKIPAEVRAMGHYRGFGGDQYSMNTESAIADIFKSLTVGAVDFFGGSSSSSREAAANAALANAQLLGQQSYEEAQTKRTLIIAGAGLAAVVLLVVLLKSSVKIKNKVGGYRRKRRSRR